MDTYNASEEIPTNERTNISTFTTKPSHTLDKKIWIYQPDIQGNIYF